DGPGRRVLIDPGPAPRGPQPGGTNVEAPGAAPSASQPAQPAAPPAPSAASAATPAAAAGAARDAEARAFDYLIIATGAAHSYFNHPEWEADAPGLKTLGDALAIREKILLAFEAAERTADPDEQRRLLTFVIIGGGPTGVELAGALAEIARQSLR